MPKISVIVPVYKVEAYLRRCVDSILAQTYTDFELILVDDGSSDGCPAICDDYATRDNRIQVIHKQNGGLSDARNAGLDLIFAQSNSEWVTFIDSDDWVCETYLECLMKVAQEYGVAISACNYLRTTGEISNALLNEKLADLVSAEVYFTEHRVNATIACAKLYRKSCFSNIRYPVGRIHEDEFVTYRLLFANDAIAVIKAPLYYYYINENSITESAWRPSRMDGLDAYKEQITFFKKGGLWALYKKSLITYVWQIAAMRDEVLRLQDDIFFEKYAVVLLKRLRKELRTYHKDLPIKQFASLYELAFPKRMQAYWLCRTAGKKIKSIFKRST